MNTNNCDDDLELENLRLAALKSMQTKTSKCKPEVQNITSEIERKVERNFKRTRNNFSSYNKHVSYNQYASFNQQFTSNRSNLIVLTSESDKSYNKNQTNNNGHINFDKKRDKNFKYCNNDKLHLSNKKNEDLNKKDFTDKPTDSLPIRFRRIEKDSDSDDSDDDIQSNFDENDIEKYRQTYFDSDEGNENKNCTIINETEDGKNLNPKKEVAGIVLDVEEESQQNNFNFNLSEKKHFKEENDHKDNLDEETKSIIKGEKNIDCKEEEKSIKMNLRSRKNLDNSKERKRITFDKDEIDNVSKKSGNKNKTNIKTSSDECTKNYSELSPKTNFSKKDSEKRSRIEVLNKSSIVKIISDKPTIEKRTRSTCRNKEIEENKNYTNRKSLRSLIVKR